MTPQEFSAILAGIATKVKALKTSVAGYKATADQATADLATANGRIATLESDLATAQAGQGPAPDDVATVQAINADLDDTTPTPAT